MSTAIDWVKADYYLYQEAARRLGISKPTLWRWIHDGKVKIERLGREVLIEKTTIDALAKERTT